MDRLKTNVLNFSMPGLNSCLWNCRNLSCETETATSAMNIKGSIMILKWTGLPAFSWALVVHCSGVSKPRHIYNNIEMYKIYKCIKHSETSPLFLVGYSCRPVPFPLRENKGILVCFWHPRRMMWKYLWIKVVTWLLQTISVHPSCEPWLKHFASHTMSRLAFTNTGHQNP